MLERQFLAVRLNLNQRKTEIGAVSDKIMGNTNEKMDLRSTFEK